MEGRIRIAVDRILRLLAVGDYEALAAQTAGIRLSAHEMRAAIQHYGRTLVFGERAQMDAIDVIKVKHAIPHRWSVNVPLWTMEEGRSDLSLELTLVDQGTTLRAEIDDIHVL